MKIFQEFFFGLGAYGKAFSFSNRHRMWGYYAIPAVLNLLLLGAVGWLAWEYTADLSHFLSEWFGVGRAEGRWAQALEFFVLAVVRLSTLFFFLKIYKYLMLALLSPAFSFIGGKVQDLLHGTEAPFSWRQLLSDMARGMAVAARSLFWELLLTGLLVALSFIPVLAPFTALLLVLLEWYFLGLSMADVRHEYKRLNARDALRVSRRRKGLVLGIGAGMYLFLLVPLLGVLLAPIFGMVAAGIAFYELEDARPL
jgi:CysZ protein